MTTKQEATGTTNPTARAMLRYVYGPLEGQSISGTVKGQMRGVESISGANASLALAIKIIQPDGTDRAVLLAQTAADSQVSGTTEFVTSGLTNARFLNASEANPTLTTQSATRGDYLVIEIGFRSATGTSRTVDLRYGDTGGTDLTDGDTTETTDLVPWIEFSDDIVFIDRTPGAATATLAGLAPAVALGVSMGLGALGLAGGYVGVAFPGAETGALAFAGQAPTVNVGTGTNTDIAVPAGSLTLAGADPSLRYDFVIDVPSGSLALSGQAPNAAIGGALPVPVGALALTGEAPAASIGYGLPVPVGALAFTGEAPTLSETSNTTLAIPAGALTLAGGYNGVAFPGAETGALVFAGQAPTVSVLSGVILNPPAGALTIAGNAPTLQYDIGRAIPAGALTFAGQAPNASIGYMRPVPAGALTLAGTNVSIAFIDPGWGVLTLQGYAPTLDIVAGGSNVTIDVPVGALTLTGQAAVASIGIGRAADVGTLTFAGQAPVASVAYLLPIPAGALTLSGQAPAAVGTGAVQPGAATLTLAGQAANVKLDLVIATPVGALTLTGQAPVASVAYGLPVPVGALSLAGAAPVASIGIIRAEPAGALTFAGLAPTLATTVGRAPDVGALTFAGQAPALRTDFGRAMPAGALTLAGAVISTAAPLITVFDAVSTYQPIVDLVGAYSTEIALEGSYIPTIDLVGELEE